MYGDGESPATCLFPPIDPHIQRYTEIHGDTEYILKGQRLTLEIDCYCLRLETENSGAPAFEDKPA